jgi:hypothetical protein
LILIFQEDGVLAIADDEAAVYRSCEGIDVHSGIFKFYDDNGNALKAVFDVPVKQGKWWSLWSIDSGVYHLEVDPESRDDPLWLSFSEISDLEPNARFASLEQLKTFMRERGAAVDRPGEPSHAQ